MLHCCALRTGSKDWSIYFTFLKLRKGQKWSPLETGSFKAWKSVFGLMKVGVSCHESQKPEKAHKTALKSTQIELPNYFTLFNENNWEKVWWFQKKVVPLQLQTRSCNCEWRLRLSIGQASLPHCIRLALPLHRQSGKTLREAATRCSSLQKNLIPRKTRKEN